MASDVVLTLTVDMKNEYFGAGVEITEANHLTVQYSEWCLERLTSCRRLPRLAGLFEALQ